MTRSPEGFLPAAWLPGAHLQTIWGRLFRPKRLVRIRREELETPDGDVVILDHLEPEHEGRPRLLLLHGLEGSSFSAYMQGLMFLARERDWNATAFNFRSCSRDLAHPRRILPNRAPRLYHSGETTDLDFVVRTLKSRDPGGTLIASGVSLGGNVLLKWLGEHPDQTDIAAAATLSVPYDLAAGARALETRLGRMYTGVFLSTLRPKVVRVATKFPEARERVDLERLRRAATFYEFDDAGTAPLHGFLGADDYYARSSSLAFLDRIATPTLCVSSADDPFQPERLLPRVRERASDAVSVEVTSNGGHAGFVGGMPWRPLLWAEMRMIGWLEDQLKGQPI
jgi:predicted alpha/beta-fold hydrolase